MSALVPHLSSTRSTFCQTTGASPVLFLGRSLEAYSACFAFDPTTLRGRDVLEVGAGASSFAAEACTRRIDAVAVDAVYGDPVETLRARILADELRATSRTPAARSWVRGKTSPRLPDVALDRRTAAERFMADYEVNFPHGRYVRGALPHLPFFDRTFDLVLCRQPCSADGRTDLPWMLTACAELLRVTASEARIHFQAKSNGTSSSGVARLQRELRENGIASELVGQGALVLRRTK